jgi:hypothetical protein
VASGHILATTTFSLYDSEDKVVILRAVLVWQAWIVQEEPGESSSSSVRH